VLDGLREAGLITYPSPLLRRFLEELPEVFEVEVLPRLDPTYRALFSRAGGSCRAAVVASSLPRAGKGAGGALKFIKFIESVPLLAWAKDKGCPWDVFTFVITPRSAGA